MSRPFLVRAGSVIDCLAGERGPATLDDIQRRTGIQRNSLIKLLAVLQDQGWVDRDRDRFVVGRKLVGWGLSVASLDRLPEEADATMRCVSGRTGLNVTLSILSVPHVVFVKTVGPTPENDRAPRLGGVMKLYQASACLACLAAGTQGMRGDYWSLLEGQGCDPYRIEEARTQVEAARRDGIARTVTPARGTVCEELSKAVIGLGGDPLGAITLWRCRALGEDAPALDEAVPVLHKCIDKLSARMGYIRDVAA